MPKNKSLEETSRWKNQLRHIIPFVISMSENVKTPFIEFCRLEPEGLLEFQKPVIKGTGILCCTLH